MSAASTSTGGLARAVARFDDRADRALEPWRTRRGVDRMFHLASTVGDFSAIWHVIGLTIGLLVQHDPVAALWFSACIGLESLVVNQVVKRCFRRTRPTETGDPRFPVRRPRTSSFPSGHASSAMFAATLLSVWNGWAWAPLWFVVALIVATSRAIVRIHHPSDVVGGMVTGFALAGIAVALGVGQLLT